MARPEAIMMTALVLLANLHELVAPPVVANQVSCPQVGLCIVWCIGYARSGGELPHYCCDGLKYLLGTIAVTVHQRQQACECVKAIMGVIPGLKMSLVAGIPRRCQIDGFDFHINQEMDCSKVK